MVASRDRGAAAARAPEPSAEGGEPLSSPPRLRGKEPKAWPEGSAREPGPRAAWPAGHPACSAPPDPRRPGQQSGFSETQLRNVGKGPGSRRARAEHETRAAGGPGLQDSEKSPGACPQRTARALRLAQGWAPRRLSARGRGSQPAFPSRTRPRSEHTTRPGGFGVSRSLTAARSSGRRTPSAPGNFSARHAADSNPSQSAAHGRWGVEREPGNGPGEGGLEIVFATR